MVNPSEAPNSSSQDHAHQANAVLFITDLKSNTQLSDAWNSLLAKMKVAVQQVKQTGKSSDQINQTYQDAIQAADNFLADNGYDTTATVVLTLLKSPFYEDYLKETSPNDESDRFVQTLLTSTEIYKPWQALLTKVVQGQTSSTELDAFLQQHGFKCSYLQVNASFVKMRNHNMNYWSGSYPNTVITGPNGQSRQGRLVVVYGNNKISLDHDKPERHINKLQYNNSVLTWQADMLVKYSGNLTFSEITLPTREDSYTGSVFSGTLTYEEDDPINNYKKGDVLQISGRLASLSQDDVNHRLPANEDPLLIDKILKWINYALLGLFIVRMLISIGKKYTSFQEFESDSNGAFKTKLLDAAQRAEQGAKDVAHINESPFRQLDFKGSDMLKDLELKISEASGEEKSQFEQEYEQQKAAENKFDKQPEEETEPEGDGWASDLEDLARIL
ncbi:hypothetical protein NIES4073_67970 [Kalymmatonema gypsitolerans NIES-4073]|nr:hypothetical protein NIES4073_67970 [Scytonema sp. NIES-4073]